jgi:two-component system phosphate regulon sensor histidine kinase PhoR
MKRKSILLIIGLMSFALLGVLAVQWYFIRQSYQLKSQLFDQSVNESLNNVVQKLEKQDAFNFLLNKAVDTQKVNRQLQEKRASYQLVETKKQKVNYVAFLKQQQSKADSLFNVRDSLIRSKYPLVLAYEGDEEEAYLPEISPNFQVEVFQYEDAFGRLHQQTLTRAVPQAYQKNTKKRKNSKADSVKKYVVFDPQTGPRLITLARPELKNITPEELKEEKEKNQIKYVKQLLDSAQEQKKDVIQDLAQELNQRTVPLKKRIQPLLLESLLKTEFNNKGISSDFSYLVKTGNADSVIFRKATNTAIFEEANTYRVQLFPKEMLREAGWLMISFPDKNKYILSNMSLILGLSGGLLLVLLFAFGYTLQMILQQKKISEMKTDFINNMTHEFKTPVATIMIASEALKDSEVKKDQSRIDKLANIIYDENIRLGNHIERVLNIARIEKENLKLEQKEIAVHDLMLAVADSMSLQFQKYGTECKLMLDAKNDLILGDELHLSNVLFNLLDNALKYSSTHPEIELSTLNSGSNLIIKVKDNGIGINRDQLSKIFEQFYRIPTGNLHDVKGFGLGLSYVNTIIKQLKGQIKVKSEKDKGSVFEISLPLA